MPKVKMPEPVGYFACNPESLKPEWGEDCVCQDDVYDPEETGTIGRPFVFVDQAEAYKDACVRDALEKAIRICTDIEKHYLASNPRHQHRHGAGLGASLCADRIRALIKQENKS